MSVLSGESDMASLLSLLPQLIESGNYKVSIEFYLILSFLKFSIYRNAIQFRFGFGSGSDIKWNFKSHKIKKYLKMR